MSADGAANPSLRAKSKAEAESLLSTEGHGGGAGVFGTRLLKNDADEDAVWEHNAWDHVEPPEDYRLEIQSRLDAQAATIVSDEQAGGYDTIVSRERAS